MSPSDAVPEHTSGRWHAISGLLSESEAISPPCVRELSASEAHDLAHGRRISAGPDTEAPSGDHAGRPVAAFAPSGALIALLEKRGAEAKPALVFAPGEADA